MPTVRTAESFLSKLRSYRSPDVARSHRHLAAGEDDQIMGVRMGQVFALAKEYMDMPLDEVEKLLESPIHEARVGAVSIMDYQARSKKTSQERRKELFDLYIRRHDRINTWDLVDRSAIHVVGGYLMDKPRTAMVSTLYFIGKGDVDDALQIAEMLLNDKEDLIHKAVGWALRYVGDQDQAKLITFLDKHATSMPRVSLRYATGHLDGEQGDRYLGKRGKKEKKPGG
jgi:3-methyladenine DNA glycosylase AlkD